MSKIVPNSTISLYSGVDITSGQQVVFRSKSAQSAYFAKKKVFTSTNNTRKFTYLRRGGTIKIEISASQASQCDYLSFRNPSFEDREFYAKITNYEYISNKVTEFTYAIDDFQTYMFDVTYEWGKIEREHLSQSDFVKSLQNPYDPSIYEFQTAENLPSSRELEIIYPDDHVSVFPEFSSDTLNQKVVFMYIANFDFGEFDNIERDFVSLFDQIIDSAGNIVKGGSGSTGVRIGRGYGIYEINIESSNGQNRFKSALDWLTLQGLDSQVIGVYQTTAGIWALYLQQLGDDPSQRSLMTIRFGPYAYSGIESTKLYLSPYTYFRVYNNEGDCKEYKYEKFNEMQLNGPLGNAQAELVFIPAFDGSPMTTCIPSSYMRTGYDFLNTDERIDCHQIPQVGYCTDAYLAFLASQYTESIATRTNTVGEALNSRIDASIENYRRSGDDADYGKAVLGGGIRSFMSGLKNIGQSFSSGGGMVQGGVNAATSLGNVPLMDVRNETASWRSGGTYESSVFGPAKPAYVADEYHAGSTNGMLGEYLVVPRTAGTFTIEQVQLNPTIISQYDNFFKGYGYTSNRVGIPRICNYINGGTDIPHFSDFEGKSVTYVKTTGMHVDHTLASVCENIENMFNSGCQFLKGEDL